MRKPTIAEQREKALNIAVTEFNTDYNTLKKIMNRFYRLNADKHRLSYMQNSEKHCNSYTCKRLEESTERRSKQLNADLEQFGLCLDYFSHLATICYKGTTRTAIHSYYYNE